MYVSHSTTRVNLDRFQKYRCVEYAIESMNVVRTDRHASKRKPIEYSKLINEPTSVIKSLFYYQCKVMSELFSF